MRGGKMRGADEVRSAVSKRASRVADTSFNRLLGSAFIGRDPATTASLRPHRLLRFEAPLDRDELRGKVQRASGASGSSKGVRLSKGLDERLCASRRFGARQTPPNGGSGFDARQRAIVKIHYFGHGGGGGAALGAHARYIAREAAAREQAPADEAPQVEMDAERQARAHAAYLAREAATARSPFYDFEGENVDGAARAAAWARADRRHFRIILAPENGADLKELKPYVREVMNRAEVALGTKLEWVAVDHWDTDNPHTHIVLRGRREDGRDLVIPREYVQHGFRNAARDAATARLGDRTRAHERLALDRETRAHRPTRLDAIIAAQLADDGSLRVSKLEAPNEVIDFMVPPR